MPKQPVHICTVTADLAVAESWRDAIEPLATAHTAFDGLVTALRRIAELTPDIIVADRSASDLNDDQLALKIRHRAPATDLLLATDATETQRLSGTLTHWNVISVPRDSEPSQLRARLKSIVEDRIQVAKCRWTGTTPQIRSASNLLLILNLLSI